MYVCGITPYDATHIGHAATYVTFDLVHRVWLDAGHDVHYVQNVTDVDDPLLERAARDGEDWAALADRETTLFREDMTSLGVVPPRNYVGAVESIPDVVAAVRTLREQGRGVRRRRRHLLLGAQRPQVRRCRQPGRRDDARAVRGARRRPGAPGQEAPARLPPLAVGPTGRALLGHRGCPSCRTAGRAGTSSARRSPCATSATPSTCRAAGATWCSRTTR
jgi:L-cysteine:1D-myo-inositol 2-amino-2-deoxy-alpha-D-glucopyranoside ligase